MKKTIFISGPMAGVRDYDAIFEAAARDLSEAGNLVVNPAALTQVTTEDAIGRDTALLLDLAMLAKCDAMVQLPGWRDSSGCRAEWAFAKAVGIPIYDHDVQDACPIGGTCGGQ